MAWAEGAFKNGMVPWLACKALGVLIPSLLPAAKQEQILRQIVAGCLLSFLAVRKGQAMSVGAHGCSDAALLVQADPQVEPCD